MQPFPTHPHDWALWLFKTLEQPENVDSYWQGVLPQEIDFDTVVEALPQQLKGYCDSDRRTIEFHPKAVAVFESISELVDGPRRRTVPGIFTVRELNYTHGRTTPVPELIEQYLGAVRLWQLFDRTADHGNGQGLSIHFIKTFESKVELRCEYSASDLSPLDNLDEFARNYFESDHHRDQKRTIIRNALLEFFKGQLIAPFSELLRNFKDFGEKVRSAYTLYTTDFSFEKLRSEVDKQNLEDMLRLNKTFSDIQNQLLAIPAAILLVGANVKADNFTANISTAVGISIFSWIMWKLIRNQSDSISAIHDEIRLRKDKVEEQSSEISEKLLPRFSKLSARVVHQQKVLGGIRKAVAIVWIITILIVAYVQWPEFFPYLFDLLIETTRTLIPDDLYLR
ncbi:hypothetical protein [Comamonas terrigena]|uniref:hypothetical protein n=1 Tax=Comamonas terrigena TaxID=32013 RepID=UPI00244C9C55|nr:hypothetical protein [Comamonas terrigena]MDH1502608.1 hypothetical protein [Comamonas terrigena]